MTFGLLIAFALGYLTCRYVRARDPRKDHEPKLLKAPLEMRPGRVKLGEVSPDFCETCGGPCEKEKVDGYVLDENWNLVKPAIPPPPPTLLPGQYISIRKPCHHSDCPQDRCKVVRLPIPSGGVPRK
jgi:hypothetical protein